MPIQSWYMFVCNNLRKVKRICMNSDVENSYQNASTYSNIALSQTTATYSELLGFWTLSIIRNYKENKPTQHFGNSFCFRLLVRGGRRHVRSVRKSYLNHGPNTVCLPSPTWGLKQIKFPKRCALLYSSEYRTSNKIQKPTNPEWYTCTPSSERFRIY
jgi:hypothetical protein